MVASGEPVAACADVSPACPVGSSRGQAMGGTVGSVQTEEGQPPLLLLLSAVAVAGAGGREVRVSWNLSLWVAWPAPLVAGVVSLMRRSGEQA